MSFINEISEEQLHRDHRSQMLGGTDMYTLMGHGYLEKGESHLDAVMALWERKKGLGTKPKAVNEAMRTGVEQEPAAYQRLMSALAQGKLDTVDERYEHARIYAPFRGLRIQRGNGDGYGIGGNMDAPLFDVSGQQEDPSSGAMISGEDYARRYAEEQSKIALQNEVNRVRELDGEEPWPVSEPKYKAPPFAGVLDIKVTQSASVFYDEIYNGIEPRFVVQTHHYLEVLRAESRRRGLSGDKDPELLGIYRFCLENNRTHFHEIDYDPALVSEMRRRVELFTEKCLKQGMPPNSSELRDEFYIYPVKGTEPAAELPDEGVEEQFKELLEKHDKIKERQKTVKEYEEHVKKDLGLGVRHVNGVEPEGFKDRMHGVFVDGRIVTLEKKITNKKVTNEAALNGVLLAAGGAREALASVQKVLSDTSLTEKEMVAAISQAVQQVELDRLPRDGVQLDDFQSVQRVESSEPTISIRDNKNTRAIYRRLVEERDLDASEVKRVDDEPETERAQEANPEPEEVQNPIEDLGQSKDLGLEQERGQEPKGETPPTPAQHKPATHERVSPEGESGGEVSPGEVLEETPINDDFEPLEAERPARDAKRGTAEDQKIESIEGLASKPQPGVGARGPDLLGGVIPDDLANQTLPEDLFASPEDELEGGRKEEMPPGLSSSPFMV